jgi:hypothetical protein
MNPQDQPDRLDLATAQRLSKLRSMPVETARLDAMIESQVPRPAAGPVAAFLRLRPVRAVAASIAMFGIIGVIAWSLSGGAVLASPDMIAQFHHEMVSGTSPAMQVDSIADANRMLARQWSDAVQIPQVPSEHVMLCCMHSIKDKRVACVLLKSEGNVRVTLAVAKAMDMRLPESEVIVRNGAKYHLQSSKELNMVMTERDGRWICLIAALSSDRLIEIAGSIQF